MHLDGNLFDGQFFSVSEAQSLARTPMNLLKAPTQLYGALLVSLVDLLGLDSQGGYYLVAEQNLVAQLALPKSHALEVSDAKSPGFEVGARHELPGFLPQHDIGLLQNVVRRIGI